MAHPKGSAGGGGRSAGGSVAAPAQARNPVSISQAAFERRFQRANKDVAAVRRYLNESDRDKAWSNNPNRSGPSPSSGGVTSPSANRERASTYTAKRARDYYRSLGTDWRTGMPVSMQQGFRERQRFSTGTKKKAGKKRSRLVSA